MILPECCTMRSRSYQHWRWLWWTPTPGIWPIRLMKLVKTILPTRPVPLWNVFFVKTVSPSESMPHLVVRSHYPKRRLIGWLHHLQRDEGGMMNGYNDQPSAITTKYITWYIDHNVPHCSTHHQRCDGGLPGYQLIYSPWIGDSGEFLMV